MRRLRGKAKRGFTLMEIVVAMGICALALSAILLAYASTLAFVSISKNINIATNAAEGIIEGIRNSSFSQMVGSYNGLIFTVNDLPGSRGVVYVDNTDPAFLLVTVSVCWQRGYGVVGEDLNLNGVLEPGEDANNNGMIDSAVQLVTRIARR